jgi:hypothetical protein
MFPGRTFPCIKTKDDWWNEMEYDKWEGPSEAAQQFASDTPDLIKWYEKKD